MTCRVFSAEGCFNIDIFKTDSTVTKFKVVLRLKLGLLDRDQTILKSIIAYLGCGTLFFNNKSNSCYLTVSKLAHILDIIIPLFKSNHIEGVKALDFQD